MQRRHNYIYDRFPRWNLLHVICVFNLPKRHILTSFKRGIKSVGSSGKKNVERESVGRLGTRTEDAARKDVRRTEPKQIPNRSRRSVLLLEVQSSRSPVLFARGRERERFVASGGAGGEMTRGEAYHYYT